MAMPDVWTVVTSASVGALASTGVTVWNSHVERRAREQELILSRALDLATDEETPGHYAGSFIPTKTGDYIFHIFGNVGSTKVEG